MRTKQTMNSTDGSRNELDGSLNYDQVNDNEWLAAMNDVFPDEMLPPFPARVVEQRSISVDTSDLPNVMQPIAPTRSMVSDLVSVNSVCVDTSDLVSFKSMGVDTCDLLAAQEEQQSISVVSMEKQVIPMAITKPPSPVVTPMETEDGAKSLLDAAKALPFPDLGPDCIPNSPSTPKTVNLDESADRSTPVLSTPKRVAWAASPERNRIWQMPAEGFSTPRPRSNTSAALRSEMVVSKTPNPSSTSRRLRSQTQRGSNENQASIPSPVVEPRELRPRSAQSTRRTIRLVESLRARRTSCDSDSSGHGARSVKRSTSLSSLAKPAKCSKPEQGNDDLKKPSIATPTKPKKKNSLDRLRKKMAPKKRCSAPVSSAVSTRPSPKTKATKSPAKRRLEKEENHICEPCDKFFKTKIGLRTHTESIHLGIRYKCKFCDQVANMMPTLGVHLNKIHPDKVYCKGGIKDMIIRITG